MTKVSLKSVIANNSDKAGIIKAVIKQLGGFDADQLSDIRNHGVNGGFSGFIYYSDTVAFYRKNRKAINEWVIQVAEEYGEEPVSMVCGFNCIRDKEEASNVGRCIYDGRLNDETKQIENALAWFAAEEVARLFENE